MTRDSKNQRIKNLHMIGNLQQRFPNQSITHQGSILEPHFSTDSTTKTPLFSIKLPVVLCRYITILFNVTVWGNFVRKSFGCKNQHNWVLLSSKSPLVPINQFPKISLARNMNWSFLPCITPNLYYPYMVWPHLIIGIWF